MRQNDAKFEDFAEGPGTYFTVSVAADHEKFGSYDDVLKNKIPKPSEEYRVKGTVASS